MRRAIDVLIDTAILFLMFAFIMWDINPMTWTPQQRAVFVVLLVAYHIIAMNYDIFNRRKDKEQ